MTTSTDSQSPLRFGVVGLGRAGAGMLPALRTHPCATVVAAADLRLNQTTWYWHTGHPPPETGEGKGGGEEPDSMPHAPAPPSQPSPTPGGRSMVHRPIVVSQCFVV